VITVPVLSELLTASLNKLHISCTLRVYPTVCVCVCACVGGWGMSCHVTLVFDVFQQISTWEVLRRENVREKLLVANRAWQDAYRQVYTIAVRPYSKINSS
jgi:hypothetical protein